MEMLEFIVAVLFTVGALFLKESIYYLREFKIPKRMDFLERNLLLRLFKMIITIIADDLKDLPYDDRQSFLYDQIRHYETLKHKLK